MKLIAFILLLIGTVGLLLNELGISGVACLRDRHESRL